MLRSKPIYEPVEPEDCVRIFGDMLWLPGLEPENAPFDEWPATRLIENSHLVVLSKLLR